MFHFHKFKFWGYIAASFSALLISIGLFGGISSPAKAADTTQASAATPVEKIVLKNTIRQARYYEQRLSNYAKVSQNRLDRSYKMAVTLSKDNSATELQVKTVTNLLNSAIDPDNLVKTSHNNHRYTAAPLGQKWLDTDGAPIQAHGGGFLKQTAKDGKPIYYWVGEDKSHNSSSFNGINLYSSRDLLNWTYRDTVMAPSLTNKGLFNNKVERPKILFNQKTGKYVVWGHWETQDNYTSSQICVATSKKVDGKYTFLGHWRPGADAQHHNWRVNNTDANGGRQALWDNGATISDYSDENTWGTGSRDFTLYQDGNDAYLISSAGKNMNIFKLNDDFTDIDKTSMKPYTLFNNYREAPAMIHAGNYYFLITSSQTGWYPNQASYSYTTSIKDSNSWHKPSTASPQLLGNNTAFYSQATNIMQVGSSANPEYLYMGDRWVANRLGNSSYIWLPLTIKGADTNTPSMSLQYNPNWVLDPTTNSISTNEDHLISQGKPASTNAAESSDSNYQLKNANDGIYTGNAYFKPLVSTTGSQVKMPYNYTVDLQKDYNLSRIDTSFFNDGNNSTHSTYTIQTSSDGQNWTTVVDKSKNTDIGFTSDKINATARYVRLTVNSTISDVTGMQDAGRAGLVEFQVYGH